MLANSLVIPVKYGHHVVVVHAQSAEISVRSILASAVPLAWQHDDNIVALQGLGALRGHNPKVLRYIGNNKWTPANINPMHSTKKAYAIHRTPALNQVQSMCLS